MSLKRVANKSNKKARNCLKCNRHLTNLKDNVVNTCEGCGQRHLVDFYTNNTIVLTVANARNLDEDREKLKGQPRDTNRTRKLLIKHWKHLERSGKGCSRCF